MLPPSFLLSLGSLRSSQSALSLLLTASLLLGLSACSPTQENSTSQEPALLAPAPSSTADAAPQFEPTVSARVRAEGQLGPGPGTLLILLEARPGTELTQDAPLRLRAFGEHLEFPEPLRARLQLDELPLRVPVVVRDGAVGPAHLELTYYYCTQHEEGSCRPERAALTVDLDLSGSAPGGEAFFTHRPAS